MSPITQYRSLPDEERIPLSGRLHGIGYLSVDAA